MRWLSAFGLSACLIAGPAQAQGLDSVDHFVILVEENNSFDKLYGRWEGVDGVPVVAEQTDQDGNPLTCLLQTVPVLSVPPLTRVCGGMDPAGRPYTSHFPVKPFLLDGYDISAAAIRHGFYQERYQVNGGRMDRFVVGNDQSAGLTLGMWDTRRLPLYRYLHGPDAPNYVIADRFFHAAYGGSFLNHQWLIAGRTPTWRNPPPSLRAVVDGNGMPGTYPQYPLYRSASTKALRDGQVTARCDGSAVPCGDFVVNTSQPAIQPFAPGTTHRVPPLTGPTIGSRLTQAGVTWAWFAQGWSDAAGLRAAPGWTNGKRRCTSPRAYPNARYPYCASVDFQFHHQPFVYYKAFDPATARGRANRRAHLKDVVVFDRAVARSRSSCRLPGVSFVKFMNPDNEHPGAGGPHRGSRATVRLIRSVVGSACADSTMIMVIYDENGGAWDHVAPPSGDQWGPGARTPALIVAPGLPQRFRVDSAVHDTTSVIATLRERFGLRALPTRPYADFSTVWR